ncbi:Cytochrome oxidase biogenesis protein Surf1, facilitates heme A insertion [hydrothermal vent metagenome]|uniref:Cytochrome oxidase biogenesis protein Surf1, facilitates heme A insertion n=1 Tax=hydrothermal vent metagenome TaxID=652676 RepID=A0A3B0YTY6_9ZZZZ
MRVGPYKFSPTLVPTLATVLLVGLLMWLGNWQLGRADYKQSERDKRKINTTLPAVALTSSDLNVKKMLGRKTNTTGHFDTKHEAVLAYQKYNGYPGFLVLSPFLIANSDVYVLVIRGWIPQSKGFTELPLIPDAVLGRIKLRGFVDRVPAVGLKTGKPDGQFAKQWPKMLIYADLDWYRKKLGNKFLPYVVKQTHRNSPGLINDWNAFAVQRERMPAEKHWGYALQWFSLAIVLLILYAALNLTRVIPVSENSNKEP